MSDKKKDDQKTSFWQTFPGCVTAIAGLITAVVGAVVALAAVGIIEIPDDVTPTPFPPIVIAATNPSEIIPAVPSDIAIQENIQPTSISIPPTSTFTPVPPTSTSSPTATPNRDTSFYSEAENGQLGNGAYAEQLSNASQGLFVNFAAAGTVKFTLNNMKAGQYTVLIQYTKYANNTATYPDTGFQNLYVNNNPNPISIYFTKTFGDGDSAIWSDTSVTIALVDGRNTLIIAAIQGSVGGSADYIYVSIIN